MFLVGLSGLKARPGLVVFYVFVMVFRMGLRIGF